MGINIKGRYDGKLRHARKIPLGETAYCPECGERLRPWKNREGVATHLKHIKNMGPSGSGGGGGGNGCSGAEGDDHERWKGYAADALEDAFESVDTVDGFSTEEKTELVKESGVRAPVSDKQWRVGDIVLVFDEPDWQFGKGLIVEVQDQNKSKNLTLTTQDYIEQDFSVIWLYEEDFIESKDDDKPGKCRLGKVEFRNRARQATYKYGPLEKYTPHRPYHSNPFHRSFISEPDEDRDVKIPAKVPDEYFAKQQRRYWMRQPWRSRFRDEVKSDTEKTLRLRAAIGPGTVTRMTATLPPECIDTMIYNQLNWDSIKPVTNSGARHRLRAAVGSGTTTHVDARLNKSLVLPTEREYWQQQPWTARFGFSTYNQYCMDDMNCMASRYQKEVARTSKTSGSDAKLPPEYVDTLYYRNLDWDTIPDSTAADEYLDELKLEYSEPSINISFTQWLSEDFWLIAYLRGMARRSGLLQRGHEKNPSRPPKPANPFNDIQCQNCGHYKHVSEATKICEHCSTLYDLSWNVETGRVSSDLMKEHILSTQATDD